jgi:hypothetical protein
MGALVRAPGRLGNAERVPEDRVAYGRASDGALATRTPKAF